MINIDEIYDLFMWDDSYTPEEYSSREQQGIELARNAKYLFPFLQPILPQKSKSIWGSCAKVIAERTDDELKPYLPALFEWLQDLNWPGSDIVFNRLVKMPTELTDDMLEHSKLKAKKNNDGLWLDVLRQFEDYQDKQLVLPTNIL